MRLTEAVRRICGIGAIVLIVGLFGAVPHVRAQTAGPPPGYARIWIYRNSEPFVTLARPYLRFNGRVVAISEPGGDFYRDVPPGLYRITIDSRGEDWNQFATVAVVAGQTIYVKVHVNNWWATVSPNSEVNTFYTYEVPPPVALAAMTQTRFYGGG